MLCGTPHRGLKQPHVRSIGAAVLALALLTGCGGGDDAGGIPTHTATPLPCCTPGPAGMPCVFIGPDGTPLPAQCAEIPTPTPGGTLPGFFAGCICTHEIIVCFPTPECLTPRPTPVQTGLQ